MIGLLALPAYLRLLPQLKLKFTQHRGEREKKSPAGADLLAAVTEMSPTLEKDFIKESISQLGHPFSGKDGVALPGALV